MQESAARRSAPPWRVPQWAVKGALQAASLALFALFWEWLALRLDSLLMPTFSETVVALAGLATTPLLWQAIWASNQAMILGFALAVAAGVPLGILMGRWRAAEQYLDPYLNILLVTPMSALIPILIMAAGLGLFSRVLIVFSFAFVMVAVNARAGLRLVEPAWIEMAQSFGAGRLQLWRTVLIPGALPGIAAGLRQGLARAVTGMITVELLLVALGLGRLILDFQGTFDSARLFAVILVVVGEAVLLIRLVTAIERRLTPWAREHTSR